MTRSSINGGVGAAGVVVCLLLPIAALLLGRCTLGQLSPVVPEATAEIAPDAAPEATPETTSTVSLPSPLPGPVVAVVSATVPSPTSERMVQTPTGVFAATLLTPTQTVTPEVMIASPTAALTPPLLPLSPTAVLSASTTVTPLPPALGSSAIISRSVQGRAIITHQLNDGPQHVVVVGGIHGGYEWNSILLSYELLDYFTANPALIPPQITLHIIPSANPDGQFLVTQQEQRFSAADVVADTVDGRFNANGVDLNRNWDCRWSPSAMWRDTVVDGGRAPFSEPESVALRDYFLLYQPEVVIFLHSAANGVFASGCPDTHQPSFWLATVYGEAAGYPVYEAFNAYPITGDAGDWLTTIGIPSFTVELRNHSATDWSQNRAGLLALLEEIGASE